MIELSAAAYSSVPPLREVPIFTGFARAVLDHLAEGRVWCEGGAAHVLHGYGMSLVWGEGVGRAFPALLEHLKGGAYRDKDEWLQVDPRWQHLDWDQLNAERFGRVNFGFDRAAFGSRTPVLPPGWTLAAMDEGAFNLSDVHVAPRAFWRDLAAFRAHGGGIAAINDGEIGAIAFSATRADDWLEIGIETRAPYRGQGLARAVATAMIAKCLASGLAPVWACRKQNTASLKLAQSLGFVVTKEVPFWRLAA